jgi:hypothetical protein
MGGILTRGALALAAAFAITGVAFAAGSGQSAARTVQGYRDFTAQAPAKLRLTPTKTQRAALRSLKGVRVRWNYLQGVPTSLIRYRGYLTHPQKASAAAIARGFLARNAELFRLSKGNVHTFALQTAYRTKHNGVRQVTLQQRDHGRAVYGGRLTYTIDRRGRIVFVSGAVYPGATAPVKASISAAEAVEIAAKDDGFAVESPLTVISWESGPSSRTTFANSIARGLSHPTPITAELVSYPVAGGATRLAWRLNLELTGSAAYDQLLDARTGELLERHNQVYSAGPQGLVYTAQSPKGATQQIVSFAGWVTDRAPAGNNANAYVDNTGDDASDYQTQTPAAPDPNFQNFNYPFTDAYQTSSCTDRTTDQDATLTQLFYWVNFAHDYYYGLGFNEAARNFQNDNFGRGGAGNDRVNAEAFFDFDDTTKRNNASFLANNDGTNGRLRVLAGAPPFPCRESEMEGDTILHEYGHGVSNRLVGGGSLGSGVQTGGMGEGWSDFFAISIFNDPVIFEYSGGGDANTPPTSGFRRITSYDTSTMKYSNLCKPTACEVHNDGEIWATALWNLRKQLLARYGFIPGKAQAEQLVIDGLKNTSTNPTFLTARDAIFAADKTNNPSSNGKGANYCLIWGVFAARQMGFSASTTGSNDQTPTTATNGPSDCTPVAEAGTPYSTPEGTNAALSGSGSTENGDGPFNYAWDLDNNGSYETPGKNVTFTTVGQDGSFTVGLQITNGNGFSSTDTATVNVTNVAPSVNVGSDSPAATPKPENTAVTISGKVTDPGWLDPLTATIDFGDGAGAQALSGVLENARPDATLTYSVQHTYGDDGTFVVKVCAADDDTTGNCNSTSVVIANVNPTATINTGSTTVVNGVPTFIAHAGQPLTFSGNSKDPGSDDLTLTWNWADGTPNTSTPYLVNPPLADPDPSPSIQPRDVTDTHSHAFSGACLYTITFSSLDDDAGSASQTAEVIIAGNATSNRSVGYWYQAYRRNKDFSDARLNCYLQIVSFMSLVFNEKKDASTIPLATDVLNPPGNMTETLQFDRQLLAAWLNFANGSIELSTPVDTNGDHVNDSSFGAAMQAAEAVRLNPASTKAQLNAQKDIVERINLRNGG